MKILSIFILLIITSTNCLFEAFKADCFEYSKFHVKPESVDSNKVDFSSELEGKPLMEKVLDGLKKHLTKEELSTFKNFVDTTIADATKKPLYGNFLEKKILDVLKEFLENDKNFKHDNFDTTYIPITQINDIYLKITFKILIKIGDGNQDESVDGSEEEPEPIKYEPINVDFYRIHQKFLKHNNNLSELKNSLLIKKFFIVDVQSEIDTKLKIETIDEEINKENDDETKEEKKERIKKLENDKKKLENELNSLFLSDINNQVPITPYKINNCTYKKDMQFRDFYILNQYVEENVEQKIIREEKIDKEIGHKISEQNKNEEKRKELFIKSSIFQHLKTYYLLFKTLSIFHNRNYGLFHITPKSVKSLIKISQPEYKNKYHENFFFTDYSFLSHIKDKNNLFNTNCDFENILKNLTEEEQDEYIKYLHPVIINNPNHKVCNEKRDVWSLSLLIARMEFGKETIELEKKCYYNNKTEKEYSRCFNLLFNNIYRKTYFPGKKEEDLWKTQKVARYAYSTALRGITYFNGDKEENIGDIILIGLRADHVEHMNNVPSAEIMARKFKALIDKHQTNIII